LVTLVFGHHKQQKLHFSVVMFCSSSLVINWGKWLTNVGSYISVCHTVVQLIEHKQFLKYGDDKRMNMPQLLCCEYIPDLMLSITNLATTSLQSFFNSDSFNLCSFLVLHLFCQCTSSIFWFIFIIWVEVGFEDNMSQKWFVCCNYSAGICLAILCKAWKTKLES
jgi:hypothetical protein